MSPAPAYKPASASAGQKHFDRRASRRYPINLELHYKLLKRQKVLHAGGGTSSNISSGGVLFEADRVLLPGSSIELSLAWPLTLGNTCPLQLKILGQVVRTNSNTVAVKINRYEFRTAGSRLLQRTALESRRHLVA